jgi:hypothetical protein
MGLVAEEADESFGWLEFIEEARLLNSKELPRLIAESRELVAIMSASHGTARENQRRPEEAEGVAAFRIIRELPNPPISITRLPNYPIIQFTRAPPAAKGLTTIRSTIRDKAARL